MLNGITFKGRQVHFEFESERSESDGMMHHVWKVLHEMIVVDGLR